MTMISTHAKSAQVLSADPPPLPGEGARSPLYIGRLELGNRCFLAPLSGITDVPFRRLARRLGAGLVVSEMVASGEFARGDQESAMRAMRDGAGLHVVQLAGRDPGWMKAAAEQLVGLGVDIIDINLGCPAKKVVGGLSGAALMREPDLALRLIEAVVEGAGAVPVTVKMRLGWSSDSINAPDIASRAEAAGARMVTVHGRTRDQFYEGRADWRAIAAVKRAVGIPVVANGDLVHPEDEAAMRQASGADAVMVGRGAVGRPWFPGLTTGAIRMADLTRIKLADLVRDHYENMLAHYSSQIGVRQARKHLAAYCDRASLCGQGDLGAPRTTMLTASQPEQVFQAIEQAFGDLTAAETESAVQCGVPRKAA
ncbi:tRNA dihydrouridine synthase DusB [Consotaella salsifontis]|nr:tRNA dihydrouridine synthase DusB [Consotaella salsifontis]